MSTLNDMPGRRLTALRAFYLDTYPPVLCFFFLQLDGARWLKVYDCPGYLEVEDVDIQEELDLTAEEGEVWRDLGVDFDVTGGLIDHVELVGDNPYAQRLRILIGDVELVFEPAPSWEEVGDAYQLVCRPLMRSPS